VDLNVENFSIFIAEGSDLFYIDICQCQGGRSHPFSPLTKEAIAMPRKIAISPAKLTAKRYAPLIIDFIFKRVLAEDTKASKALLISLIESFLGKFLQAKIEDITQLPTERKNRTMKQRAAVFDLHCKDSSGNRFIVEMQINKQDFFIGRALFYISLEITGLARQGGKYNFDYPRVYSLSFLNYEPNPEDAKGDIVQHIGLFDIKHSEKRYNHIHIALVILKRFKKKLCRCKTTFDLWLYLFNNLHKLKEIPPEFDNELFRPLFEVAEIAKFTDEELRSYEASMKYVDDYNATIECAKKESREESWAEFRAEMLDLMEKGYTLGRIKKILMENRSVMRRA
jgi:predicted transposase/invertase (TIGR01784 family)